MRKYIQAGKFKAECLKVMDQVKKTKKGVIITKRNIPVAQLLPIDSLKEQPIFGCMKNSIEVKKDIIKPIGEKWDVFD